MTKSLLLQVLSLLVEAVLKQLLLKSHLIIRMTVMMIIRMSRLTRTVGPYQLLVPFLFNVLNWLNMFVSIPHCIDWAMLWTFN